MRLPVASVLAALGTAAATAYPSVAQPAADAFVSFDLFAFSQNDDLGQPYRAEGFGYGGLRIATALPISAAVSWQTTAALALISNEDPESLPPTIGNANVTSASADILTLDASVALEIRRSGSPWTWRPGLYYHHQYGYIAGGVDLGLRRELRNGDATIAVDYGFRYAYPRLDYWDFSHRGRDSIFSHTLLVGWTQTLSPAWLTNLNVQLVRQDGFLSDSYNYVVLHVGDVPVHIVDERLPRHRTRVQLNARARYSPSVGLGIGLDTSGYADDWDVRHVAVEPSVSLPLGSASRARVWYRLVSQRGARYHVDRPVEASSYLTQDSDLGTFRTHGAGTTLSAPIGHGRTTTWRYTLSVFGFRRTDDITAAGADTGVRLEW